MTGILYQRQAQQESDTPENYRQKDQRSLCQPIHLPQCSGTAGYVKYNIARQVGNCLGIRRQPSRLVQRNDLVYLLREVEKYLRQNDTPPTRFGREVMGDPRFVFDLRNGRDPRPNTVARVRAFLETAR